MPVRSDSVSIENLLALIQPPAVTSVSEPVNWKQISSEINSDVPDDYKRLVELYGPGCFANFIWVHDPRSDNPSLNFAKQVDIRLDAFRVLRSQHPDEVAFKLFPEPGGFLPWGATDNGDVLGWLTSGSVDRWRVLVAAARDARIAEYPLNMTAFLHGVLTREIVCPIFPTDFPIGKLGFAVA
jgi:hypothetical protein